MHPTPPSVTTATAVTFIVLMIHRFMTHPRPLSRCLPVAAANEMKIGRGAGDRLKEAAVVLV